MNTDKELPTLRGEQLYIPFIGAIVERLNEQGVPQIIIQTRSKISDSKYRNILEIPGGKMRAFEDVFDTVRREVNEETGLTVTSIIGESERIDCLNGEDKSTLIEPFCVTQMQTGPFIRLIFRCTAIGELALSTDESKDIR